eukprot:Em0001g3820a
MFSDDAFHGFSSEEEEGVDLLSSIMDREEPSGHVEKKTRHNSNIVRREERKISPPSGDASNDELTSMKAKLRAMETELKQLREQLCVPNERPHARQKMSTEGRTSLCASTTRPSRGPVMRPDGPPSFDREVSLEVARQRKLDAESGVVTEKYSGLRIKNPLISSDQMKLRMDGRKMVRIGSIGSKLKGGDVEGDWVTIGVLVDKLPPKDSAKGDKFSVWKLSDLSSQKSLVSLFLFGKAFQEHWKTPAGHVIALLNPTIMPNKESGEVDKSNLALSLDHPQKVMQMGVSQDFTLCKANTKSGKKCTNFANKSDGGYCDYHVQGAYNRLRSQRMECQRGYGPSASKLHEKLFQKSKTELFFYGGQSFSASVGGAGGGARSHSGEKTSVKLFAPGAKESVAMVTNEIAHQRSNSGIHRDRMGVVTHEASDLMKQALRGHSMGAQYLNVQEVKEKAAKSGTTKTASDLLKEHSAKMKSKQETLQVVPKLSADAGGALFTPDNVPRDATPPSVAPPPGLATPISGGKSIRKGISLPSPVLGHCLESRPSGCATKSPLGSPSPSSLSRPAPVLRPSAAKLKALAVVQQKGPISKSAGSHHKTLSDVQKEAVRKRVQVQGDGDEEVQSKKPKLDVESHDVINILNAKSSHDWQVKEEEWEKEEVYFEQLEKKEVMEDKLKTLKELSVSVVQCKQLPVCSRRSR